MNDTDTRSIRTPKINFAKLLLLGTLLGLIAWIVRILIGKFINPPGVLDYAFDNGVVLYALLALVLGFMRSGVWYFWGAAIVLAHPFAALALTAYQQSQGADIVRNGIEGWFAFAFVLMIMTLYTAVLTTVLSAAGAGTRFLFERFRFSLLGKLLDGRSV